MEKKDIHHWIRGLTPKNWAVLQASSVHSLDMLFFSLFSGLCQFFPPNTTKHCFSLRFQLDFGTLSSCHALCGHHQVFFRELPLRGKQAALFPFYATTRKPPFLIYPNPCLSLGKVKCLHLIVIGMDWCLLKVAWRNASQAYSGGLVWAFSGVEWGGLLWFGK